MTMPEGSHAKVMRPGEGRYVAIGERARCTFKVVGAAPNAVCQVTDGWDRHRAIARSAGGHAAFQPRPISPVMG
jgi:hypothetical protein